MAPKVKASRLSPLEARVAVCYGPPGIGTSTILACLQAASQTPIRVVSFQGIEDLEEVVTEATQKGIKVILVDVEGGALEAEDVQALNDSRLICTGTGALIRFWAFPEDIIRRAKSHPVYQGNITEQELKDWVEDMVPLDLLVRTLTLTTYTIPAFDLEECVKTLALRLGIKD